MHIHTAANLFAAKLRARNENTALLFRALNFMVSSKRPLN
jgi:hypothetical protein